MKKLEIRIQVGKLFLLLPPLVPIIQRSYITKSTDCKAPLRCHWCSCSPCTTPPLTLLNTKTNTGKPDFFLKSKTLMLTHNPQRIFFYNNRFPTFSWRHLISCLAPSTSKSHQHWAPLSSQKWQLNLGDISTIWMTPKKNQTVMSISFSCSRKMGSEIVFKWLDGPSKIANISKSTPTALPAALPQYYQKRKVRLALGKHNQDPHLQSKPGVFWNKHNEVVLWNRGI